jgi:hypothetical protein
MLLRGFEAAFSTGLIKTSNFSQKRSTLKERRSPQETAACLWHEMSLTNKSVSLHLAVYMRLSLLSFAFVIPGN